MSNDTIRKKMLPRHFLIMNLAIVFLALLSVIPVNLTMRRYGFEYDLVPFTTSLICCMLPLLLTFPFFNYSRRLINKFTYRYRFLRKKFLLQIFFFLSTMVSLSLVMYFYLQNPSIPFPTRYPFILSMVAIPSSYLTTFSTLLVVEMLSNYQEVEREKTKDYTKIFSWITFVLIILLTLSQFCIFVALIMVGICFAIYLCFFIISIVKFVINEKDKKTETDEAISKPFYSWIMIVIYALVTLVYYVFIILYMVFLVKGYLIINFNEFYSGFFLAIQGSYVLLLIIFYSVIYVLIAKKKMSD